MLFRLFSILFTMASLFVVPVSSQELLKIKDIHEVMDEILTKHLSQKSMSASILQSAFHVYIEQFDPKKIYFLEQEIQPFLNMDAKQVDELLEAYQKNDLSLFLRLNEVVQKAIKRSRQYRDSIEKSPAQLFSSSLKESPKSEEWESFAKTDSELKTRIRDSLIAFIQTESRRSGEGKTHADQLKTITAYENQMQQSESQYIMNEKGLAYASASQENFFVMHILKALASSLDAHTKVLNSDEAYEMKLRLEKEYQGIGLTLGKRGKNVVITGMVEGGPAELSKEVQINDRIIEINGSPLEESTLESALDILRDGSESSPVNLVLKRQVLEDGKKVDKIVRVTLKRATIPVNIGRATSSFETFGNGIIGKIELNTFYQSSAGVSSVEDVRNEILQLQKNGNLRGLILDLRSNAGGFLIQAVKVAGLFVTSGVIVISKYSNGDENIYRDVDGKVAYDGPLVILTSKETASAAEIVAQALQDYGLAVVVGDEHTYGKGTIQSQTVTGEGNASSFFKVTIGKYYTPSGQTPQLRGVRADVVAPSVIRNEHIGEEYFDQPIAPDTIPPVFADSFNDVKPKLRSWYLRYYAPFLQQRKYLWKSMLPQLRKNSAERITHNQIYQTQLKLGGPLYNFSEDDSQMEEAVNIVKDMILLQSRA